MPKKSVLVTGGAGYIGSVLTRKLIESGYEVTILDSLVFGMDGISKFVSKKSVEFIKGDIRNDSVLTSALSGVDNVIHLAAIVGEPLCSKIPTAARQINQVATKKLLDLSKKMGLSRFIFASTCSNYGSTTEIATESNPVQSLSLYSETKVQSESHILKSASPSFTPCVLRFATAFGLSPRMRFDLLLQEFIRDALINNKIVVFGPEYWRPLVHVEDISDACILSLEKPTDLIAGEIYNIGANNLNYKKIELANLIKKYLPQIKIEIIESIRDPRNYKVSFDKIRTKLNFSTRKTVQDGIEEILNEINHGNLDPRDSDFSNTSRLTEKIKDY